MKKLVFVLLSVFLLAACSNEGTAYKTISLEQGYKMMQSNKVMVLDVRTKEEFEAGHIPNALHIPVEELESNVNKLDKKQSYFVICRSGNRSKQASQILVDNGFSNIYNGEAGMSTWPYDVE